MTRKRKAVKFIFTIPREKEDEWKFYRKILSEFSIEPTSRIWELIQKDMDAFCQIAQLTLKEKENNE